MTAAVWLQMMSPARDGMLMAGKQCQTAKTCLWWLISPTKKGTKTTLVVDSYTGLPVIPQYSNFSVMSELVPEGRAFAFILTVMWTMKMQFTPVERRRSYLYPAETSLNLQLLHQLSSLANAHGAVHWGVSFHPDDKHSHISEILKIPFGPLMRRLHEGDQLVSTLDLALVKMIKICPLCWVFISRRPLNCHSNVFFQWSLGLNQDKIHIIVIICRVKKSYAQKLQYLIAYF